MVVHSIRIGLSLSLLLASARLAGAAVQSVEDLTGCKLQNGRAVLPVAGSAGAANGPMYKFSSDKFSAVPASADGKAVSPDDAQAGVRESRGADLQYLPEKGGSLWAFSGSIAEMPGLYLSDLSGKKLDEPWPIPKTTQNLAGQCVGVREGGVYLVKTTEGRFALLRVLEKSATAAVIQFVYQGDGSTTFDIPFNPVMSYQRPVEAEPPPPRPAPVAAAPATGPSVLGSIPPAPPRLSVSAAPLTHPLLGPGDVNEPGVIRIISDSPRVAGLEPTIDTFTNQRNQMLQRRMDVIHEPARTAAEIQKKAQAVADLGALHPDEPVVADLLVTEIAFLNPRSQAREFSPDALHPCFAALKQMGKSATAAAIKGMRALDLDAPGEGIDSAIYKAKLLGMIVRSVEGDDVANFILRREADRETDPRKRAVFEFLLKQ